MLRRAINDTFKDLLQPAALSGGGFVLTFVGYILVLGWKSAVGELQAWMISAAGSIGPVLIYFFWNLACAPYRIERDAHRVTKSDLEEIRKKIGIPINWSVWSSRNYFTVLEAAHILAGVEPTNGTLQGPVSAYLQEIKWAIQEDKLKTDSPSSIISREKFTAALDGTSGRRRVNDDERIRREDFLSYLGGRKDDAEQQALANIGAQRLHQ